MRILSRLIAAGILFFGSSAAAELHYDVTASVASGHPLDALVVGDEIALDIGMYTTPDDRVYFVSGSVNDYDESVVAANAAASVIASELFYTICLPAPTGCSFGQTNLETGLRIESGVEGPGAEATFVSILAGAGVATDGTTDVPFPQFRVVMDVVGLGATVLRVGTYADYADAYTGSVSTVVRNVEIPITVVPSPSAALLLGLGLAGLGATRARDAA